MKKWFKIVEPNEPKVATIAMVHKDFEDAENRILAEAKKILNVDVNEKKVKVLDVLGFTNSKGFVEEKKKVEKKNNAERNSEFIRTIKSIFPEYKIITFKEVESICQKYSLFFTESKHFIGDIPDENINEMLEFGDRYIVQKDNAVEKGEASTFPRCAKDDEKIRFTVVATPDLINIESGKLVLQGSEYILPDPGRVVMARFKSNSFGDSNSDIFLIVTKWGDEAEIDEFHNQEEN